MEHTALSRVHHEKRDTGKEVANHLHPYRNEEYHGQGCKQLGIDIYLKGKNDAARKGDIEDQVGEQGLGMFGKKSDFSYQQTDCQQGE